MSRLSNTAFGINSFNRPLNILLNVICHDRLHLSRTFLVISALFWFLYKCQLFAIERSLLGLREIEARKSLTAVNTRDNSIFYGIVYDANAVEKHWL